jgi:hypothetical protein
VWAVYECSVFLRRHLELVDAACSYLRFISSRQTAVSVVKKPEAEAEAESATALDKRIESNPASMMMRWIVITDTDQIRALPPDSRSHLDLTQVTEFDMDWFLCDRKLHGRISAIRVASSWCSLTEMVHFLREYAEHVIWVEVDTHLPDVTRHRTMSAPTWEKVLAHEDTLGLRMGCCTGDGKWENETGHIWAEECFARAILRDANPDGVEELLLQPTAAYHPDFLWLSGVLDKLVAGLFPNLTYLAISVCAKHADQVTIPATVRKLQIFLATGCGKYETALSAPYVTSLIIEARRTRVDCNKVVSADGFKALQKLEVCKVDLRLTPPLPENLTDLGVGYRSSVELAGGEISSQNVRLERIRIVRADVTLSQVVKLAKFAPKAKIKMRGCGFSDFRKLDIDSDFNREKSEGEASDSDDCDSD